MAARRHVAKVDCCGYSARTHGSSKSLRLCASSMYGVSSPLVLIICCSGHFRLRLQHPHARSRTELACDKAPRCGVCVRWRLFRVIQHTDRFLRRVRTCCVRLIRALRICGSSLCRFFYTASCVVCGSRRKKSYLCASSVAQ